MPSLWAFISGFLYFGKSRIKRIWSKPRPLSSILCGAYHSSLDLARTQWEREMGKVPLSSCGRLSLPHDSESWQVFSSLYFSSEQMKLCPLSLSLSFSLLQRRLVFVFLCPFWFLEHFYFQIQNSWIDLITLACFKMQKEASLTVMPGTQWSAVAAPVAAAFCPPSFPTAALWKEGKGGSREAQRRRLAPPHSLSFCNTTWQPLELTSTCYKKDCAFVEIYATVSLDPQQQILRGCFSERPFGKWTVHAENGISV